MYAGVREGVRREGGSEKEGMQGWGRDVCRGRGGSEEGDMQGLHP